MEQSLTEIPKQTVNESVGRDDLPTGVSRPVGSPTRAISPQACSTCGSTTAANDTKAAPPTWIYAIGKIVARCPSISVEKEFAQATGREKTSGLDDRHALHTVLSKPENRYLVRQLCWVMTVEGLETYLLQPRDPVDFGLLVEAVRPNPSPMDLDVVIGVKGPIASPETCNGLMVPIVGFDQIYSFDRDALIKAIPRPEKSSAKEFAAAAEEVLDRLMLMTDNCGGSDEHRALNYLAVRYPAIYAAVAEAFGRNESLSSVDVLRSSLSGIRNVVEAVFSLTNRTTDVVEKFSVRVDVTEEFPFLVTKLSPYYNR
jgi:hypothetical protein